MLQKASRQKMFAKIGIFGESYSGKSIQALRLAQGLCGGLDNVAVIDTENRIGLHIYKSEFDGQIPFGIDVSGDYSPIRIMEKLQECYKAGVSCVIIDSISAVYNQAGGMIEIANTYRNAKGNKDVMGGWGDAKAKYNALMEQIKHAPCHVICVMWGNEKEEETETKGFGKSRKTAIKPAMEKNFIFQLHCNFLIDRDSHKAIAVKDKTELFSSETPFFITKESGKMIHDWSRQGVDVPESLRDTINYLIGQIKALIDDDETKSAKFLAWIKGKPLSEKFKIDLEDMFNREIKALNQVNEDNPQTQSVIEQEGPAQVQTADPQYSPEAIAKIEEFKSLCWGEYWAKTDEWIKTKNPDEKTLLQKLTAGITKMQDDAVQAESLALMITNSDTPIAELMATFDVKELELKEHPKLKPVIEARQNATNQS
jgi:hypothetical protein